MHQPGILPMNLTSCFLSRQVSPLFSSTERFSQFRRFIVRHFPEIGMLASYFGTVVFGVLLYASPLGESVLVAGGYSTDPLRFPLTFSAGFWALLLMPFVILPLVVMITRRLMRPVQPWLLKLPEIGTPEFAAVAIGLTAYLCWSFYDADVLGLLASGVDFSTSVEARFLILSRLGTRSLIVLHSLLWFLAVYATVRAFKTREVFWKIAALATTIIVMTMLFLLNMKWPVLIFAVAILIAAFTFSARPWASFVLGTVLIATAYVAVSSFVFRAGTQVNPVVPPDVTNPAPVPSEPIGKPEPAEVAAPKPSFSITSAAAALPYWGKYLALNPVHRMAYPFLVYYDVFTREGAICGGLLWIRNPPCVPTYLIYQRTFPTDQQFAGRGSSPAAVHITGYAKGSWFGAVITLIIGSFFIGLVSSLPLTGSATLGAMFVAGTIAAYHWSQLPVEAPFFNDHGLVWSGIMIVALWIAGGLRTRYLQAQRY